MRFATALILLAVLSGCAATAPKKPLFPPNAMSHVVMCWLKQPRDGASAEELILASQEFRKFPGVVDVFAGIQHSVATTRPIEDTSFDVMVVMVFESPEALLAYQRSSEHQKAVKEVLQPLTRKVVVYDAVDPFRPCQGWPGWK